MQNNFKCPKCGKEYAISRFRVTSNGHKDKFGRTIKCNECDVELEYIAVKKGIPQFGKFASLSPQEKAKVLKKRSHEHFKKHIAEKKKVLDAKKTLE